VTNQTIETFLPSSIYNLLPARCTALASFILNPMSNISKFLEPRQDYTLTDGIISRRQTRRRMSRIFFIFISQISLDSMTRILNNSIQYQGQEHIQLQGSGDASQGFDLELELVGVLFKGFYLKPLADRRSHRGNLKPPEEI